METVLEQELVTVKVRKDAWKAAKIAAAEDERSLSDVVSDAIDDAMERRKKTRRS